MFSSIDDRETFTATTLTRGTKRKSRKVHKLKPQEIGKLPYLIELVKGKPYMVFQNIDVIDGLVKGAIGTLEFIERYTDTVRIK